MPGHFAERIDDVARFHGAHRDGGKQRIELEEVFLVDEKRVPVGARLLRIADRSRDVQARESAAQNQETLLLHRSRIPYGVGMPEPKRERPWLALAAWVLYAFLVAATVILASTTIRLRKELAAANERIANLTRDMSIERGWAATLVSPSARVSKFTLTPSADAALRGRATVDPATRRAVVVFENAIAPSGHTFVVWALHGSTPVSLGAVRPDAKGRAVLRVEDVGDPTTLTALTVSLEADAAPVSEPTGPILMIGSFGD